MQQQQQTHPLQQGVSDSMPPAIITDLSKIQDKPADENQQTLEKHRVQKQRSKSYIVTQQPSDFNELDYDNGIVAKNITTKKKKKRCRRCCRKSKQSDKKCCDGCRRWLRDKCSCDNCDGCGSCGSCGSGGSFGGGGSGGSGGSQTKCKDDEDG